MEPRPQFSIVIPFSRGRRGHDTLFAVVDACLGQVGPSFEILIATNLPDPQVERVLISRKDSRVVLLCAGRLGVNAARNLGARSARGGWVLFLDDDCLPRDKLFLANLAGLIREFPEYAALGGPYYSPPGSRWRVRGYNAMASAWASAGGDTGAPVSPAENLLGGNLCVKRAVFEKFCFNEELISGGDEAEFLRRLRAEGIPLGFAPSLAIHHEADGSWEALVGRAWRQGRARKNIRPTAKRRLAGPLLRAFTSEPSLLAFAAVHFPTLYLADKAPKLSRAIKNMRGHKQQKDMSR